MPGARRAVESVVMVIRQAAAIAALPFVVTVVVPIWIARRNHVYLEPPRAAADFVAVAASLAYFAVGFALFATSLYYFWSRGRGTLAPWDPPRRFVVVGPYRFVRNPMIAGVLFVLLGEACLFRAMPFAAWTAAFAGLNAVYIPLLEEPMLAARFGEPYRQYTKHVRRFLPRLSPWTPTAAKPSSSIGYDDPRCLP